MQMRRFKIEMFATGFFDQVQIVSGAVFAAVVICVQVEFGI